MSDKDKNLSTKPSEVLKIKVPQQLPLQLILSTHYIADALHLLKCIKQLPRGTEEHRAAIRMYRRLLSEHQKQLRERTKAISTYLILKAVLKDKCNFDPEQVAQLAKFCDYKNIKTFYSNIKVLQSLQLVEYRNQTAFLCGWDKLMKVFQVEVKHVRFHYVKHGEIPMEIILKRIAMQKKEKQCEAAANYRLNKVTELQQMVSSVRGRGDLAAVNELQSEVYFNPALSTAFDLDNWLLFEVCRGDTSLSYRLWSCLFGYKSVGGFAHLKRKLITVGLIVVHKRQYILPDGIRTTKKSRSCCLGTAIRDSSRGETIFHKPDAIIYLTLNH